MNTTVPAPPDDDKTICCYCGRKLVIAEEEDFPYPTITSWCGVCCALRDRMAMAFGGTIRSTRSGNTDEIRADVADEAYRMADAMLEARDATNGTYALTDKGRTAAAETDQ